jgi:hypothetical protein
MLLLPSTVHAVGSEELFAGKSPALSEGKLSNSLVLLPLATNEV